MAKAAEIKSDLVQSGLTVELDDRDKMNPGAKFNEWEMLGVPLRIELGPKDLEKGTVVCARRPDRAKSFEAMDGIAGSVATILDEIQVQMLESARQRRDAATYDVDDYDTFKAKLDDGGGFLLAHWCGSDACEAAVQAETKATIRCITFDGEKEEGACMKCGEKSSRRVHFARAY
jgi:prolyl-tRNA synthetase